MIRQAPTDITANTSKPSDFSGSNVQCWAILAVQEVMVAEGHWGMPNAEEDVITWIFGAKNLLYALGVVLTKFRLHACNRDGME